MTHLQTAWLAAFAAILLSSAPAGAVEILNTLIDAEGNLVLDVSDDPPPVPFLNYHAQSRAAATYVCADRAGMPSSLGMSKTVDSILTERVSLDVGAGGNIRGLIKFTLPRQRVSLVCPRGFSPQLASVVYSRIEVRNPFGRTAYARDDARVFISFDF